MEHWLMVIVIAIVVWGWMRLKERVREESALEAPSLRITGKYFRDIVGESSYQGHLSKVAGGEAVAGLEKIALLVLEDGNKFDSNAVAVKIDGATVGYLSRDEARLYRDRLKRAGLPMRTYQCPASISGGGRKNYGVWLDLPDRLT